MPTWPLNVSVPMDVNVSEDETDEEPEDECEVEEEQTTVDWLLFEIDSTHSQIK